jgi:hypothetical protein
MAVRIRFPYDRRSGKDRRIIINRGYFRNGGEERRRGEERRMGNERRKDWVRVTKWSSAWSLLARAGKHSVQRQRHHQVAEAGSSRP